MKPEFSWEQLSRFIIKLRESVENQENRKDHENPKGRLRRSFENGLRMPCSLLGMSLAGFCWTQTMRLNIEPA
jgi:hypothetical protein